MGYQEIYRQSIEQPEAFWLEQAARLDWFKAPTQGIVNDENGVERWFADGVMNTCHMALDAQVAAGRGEQTALIYDSPVTDSKQHFSYRELLAEVEKLAGALAGLGVGKGDRVLIYMPMIPQAMMAMLASARLGAIHSVVFGGFAPAELAVRINDAAPKVILTASCGIEGARVIPYLPLLEAALERAHHQPDGCLVWQRPQAHAELKAGRDHDWQTLVAQAAPAPCTPVAATDPLYILYTSGTTGTPKGIVRDNGGHAVALHYSMKAIYNMEPGEVFWAASDVGWVVGHSYIVYAPLLAGCTTILYEGKPVRTPDAGAFWRVVNEYQVKALFSAPTAFRAIRKEDPQAEQMQRYDLSCLKALFLAGERLDPPTYEWLKAKSGLPVIDHWWQTETGWAIAANLAGIELLPCKAGSATRPVPGFNVQVLDEEGHECPAGVQGNIVVRRPLPPSCLPTVWGNHARFEAGYFNHYPGYYLTGDGGYIDEDGYLFVMGRIDDVINIAGHRLSTGELEEVVAAHPAVAECAVLGIADELKGQLPIALAVLKDGVTQDEASLQAQVVQQVRDEVGAIACLKDVLLVSALPKTRSGKILRAVLRKIADGQAFQVPSTIDDPNTLKIAEEAMRRRHVGVFAGG